MLTKKNWRIYNKEKEENEYWWTISCFCHHMQLILKCKIVGYLVEMSYQSTEGSFQGQKLLPVAKEQDQC